MLEEKMIHQFVKEASLRNMAEGKRKSPNRRRDETLPAADAAQDIVVGASDNEEDREILETSYWWKSSKSTV